MANPASPAVGSPLAAGSAIAALPLDAMIAAPLMGAVKAQCQASNAYADWIKTACLDDKGVPLTIPFEYVEEVVDENGKVTAKNTRKFSVPLIAILQHPAMTVSKVSVDFEMTVSTSEMTSSETAGEGSFEAKLGYGPFSVKVSGKVSHKSEQTRKTDTSSKYSFHVEMVNAGTSEGMAKVIDHITQAALANPGTIVDK